MDYGINILVVEDFGTMRKILVSHLRRLGFNHILEAADGLAAWDLISHADLDLVLTDWHMPRLGGLELLRKIRGHPATASLPVLMISVEEGRYYLLTALQAGATNYIVKPFTSQVLQAKIGMLFSPPS